MNGSTEDGAIPANESDIEAAARVADAWRFLDGIDGNGGPR